MIDDDFYDHSIQKGNNVMRGVITIVSTLDKPYNIHIHTGYGIFLILFHIIYSY